MKEGQVADTVVTTVTYPGNIAKAFAIMQKNGEVTKDFYIGKFFEGSANEHIKFGTKLGEGVVVKTAEELFDALFNYGKALEGREETE